MMTINLALIGIILQCSYLECSQLTHVESGVMYNESVHYDPETEDVIIHVPHHERDGATFRETLKVDNHRLRMSVWREENGGNCFSRSLMDFEHPLVLSEIADEAEANDQVVDSSEMVQVKIWATPEANMTKEEREVLTADMNYFCHGLPIIKMNTERVDPEGFEKRMLDDANCSSWTGQTGRKKRAVGHTAQTCSSGGGIPGGRFFDVWEYNINNYDYPVFKKRSADEENSAERENETEEASGEEDGSKKTSEEMPPWNLIHLIIGHREIGCQ